MSLGDRRHGVDDVVGALLVDRREIEHRAARIVVAALVARVFAGEKSAGERAPHHHAEALILDHRHDLALEFASRDRVIGLHRLEAREPALVGNAERLHDLPGGEVRAADRVDETAAHAIVERAQGLLERRYGVEAVDLIEIHMIEPEPFQAAGDLIHDVAAREADGIRPRPHAAAHLGRDDDVLALDAEIAQRLADLNLGLAFGIDVGRIDEIDARFERAGDELGGGGLIERPDVAPERRRCRRKGHRSKADFRDILARTAKRSIAHETSVPFWKAPRRRRGPIQPRAARLRKSRFRDQRRAGARRALLRAKARVRPLRLQRAGPSRRSSSRPRPTSSPSSGPRPSNGGPGGGCEYGRRLRTRGACCAR